MSSDKLTGGDIARGLGKLSAGWPIRRSSELFELQYGKALVEPSRRPGLVPVYGSNGKTGTHDESLFKGPGVILGRKGAGHLGVHWAEKDFWVIDTAYSLVPSDCVDLRFAYYLLNYVGLDHLKHGTSNPSLTREAFGAQYFPVPPLDEQRGITATLGALDEKIEWNRTVRLIARELLRSLYAAWFRDFLPWGGVAPASWQSGTLNQVVALVKAPTRPGVHPNLPYVPIDTIPMKSLGLDGFRPNEEAQSSLQLFRQDDILIGAMRVYFHRVAIAPFDGITRNTTFVLRASDPAFVEYALLLCDQDSTIDFARGTSKGSTMPYAVWDGGLGEMPILIPARNDLQKFSEVARPIVEIVRDAFVESLKLAELRDTLLPGLLSGRVRIPEEFDS